MSRYRPTHGGKGSAQRPVNKQKFDENFDRIFNKSDSEPKPVVNVGTKGHVDHG